MKKTFYMMNSAVFFLTMLLITATVYGASEKGRWRNIYSTDIVAYIDDMPIESYNADGKTLVLAESLIDYGFAVDYNPESKSLTITTMALPEAPPGYAPIRSNVVYEIIGEAGALLTYATVNGMKTKAYEMDGKIAIALEDMADISEWTRRDVDGNIHVGGYSLACMRTVWDPVKRTISLECIRPGDIIQTNLGSACIIGDKLECQPYSKELYYLIENSKSRKTPDVCRLGLYGGMTYFDAEAFLNAIDIGFIFRDNMLDLDSSTFDGKIGIGNNMYVSNASDPTNVLFPLDIVIAVDSVTVEAVDRRPAAYEYRGRLMVDLDLLTKAVGTQIYNTKDRDE